ncbi:MAG TPA: dTMP kinase [Candidatus Paceibacterota bacterium]|nr:dTMP kinase [Candidatus Paceibacterota bacterium]
MIIEIEGIDGVGKTTQCGLLKNKLEEKGMHVMVVKDLESTELGREISSVLVKTGSRPSEVELFSFLACKSQLFSQVIIPSITNGGIIICDRGIGSFVSYFESLGFNRAFLFRAIELAINGFRPNLTILLDVDVSEAEKRKSKKTNQSKFDMMGASFFQLQRDVFLDLSREFSWVTINGSLGIDETHSIITCLVENILPKL